MPESDLALLEAAARAAAEMALAYRGTAMEVHDKPGGQGPVSEADTAIDAMLHDRLTAARPGYGWLSEERGDDPARLSAERCFVVDPIDGTRPFLHGEAGFGHALAVVEGGRPVAGVVHLPVLGRLYAGGAGAPATLNGAPVAVRDGERPEGAILASRAHLEPAHWPGGVPAMQRRSRHALAWRLALVAEGSVEALATFRRAWEWDVAAGAAVLEAAGGTITDAAGRPLAFNRREARLPGLLAAGPMRHAALMRLRAGAAAIG